MNQVFNAAVETLKKMLDEMAASEESGVVGVDIVVKQGYPHAVNRKMMCQGEVPERHIEKRQRFPL